jgi:hypothetical protein
MSCGKGVALHRAALRHRVKPQINTQRSYSVTDQGGDWSANTAFWSIFKQVYDLGFRTVSYDLANTFCVHLLLSLRCIDTNRVSVSNGCVSLKNHHSNGL